jgi:hypothetical protein
MLKYFPEAQLRHHVLNLYSYKLKSEDRIMGGKLAVSVGFPPQKMKY